MKNKLSSVMRERILPLLKRIFLHNWGTKLVSFVFALVLWNYAVLTLETTRNVVIQDVSLTVTNSTMLRQRGLSLSQSVQDAAGSIRVTVATPLSGAGLVNAEQISVTCDLSSISTAGTHIVNLNARSIHGEIRDISPSRVTLEVEALATKELPIHVQTLGSTARNCYADEAECSVNSIILTGPSALISTITQARVDVALNNASQNIENSYPIILADAQGETVASSLISQTAQDVIVRIPIVHQKEFSILAEECLIGTDNLQQGYKIAAVEVYPQTLQVEGSAMAIQALDEAGGLTLSQIDLTGASADVRTYANIFLPNGAVLSQPQSVLVIVRIERDLKTKIIADVPIEIRNVHTDLKCLLSPDSLDLTITGPADLIERIPESHIELYVDTQNRSAGTFIAPVHILIDEMYESTVTPSQTEVTVTLQRIEPQE